MVFGAMADISLITVALAAVSQFLQNKFAHRDEMKKHQDEIKKKQAKMNELMKKKDSGSQKELEQVQGEMLEEMNRMMSKSTKVMMFSLVVFLPAYWVLGAVYGKDIIALPVPLPWLKEGFDLFNLGTWGIQLYNVTNWFGWYFVSYLVTTIAIGQLMNLSKKFGNAKTV